MNIELSKTKTCKDKKLKLVPFKRVVTSVSFRLDFFTHITASAKYGIFSIKIMYKSGKYTSISLLNQMLARLFMIKLY